MLCQNAVEQLKYIGLNSHEYYSTHSVSLYTYALKDPIAAQTLFELLYKAPGLRRRRRMDQTALRSKVSRLLATLS